MKDILAAKLEMHEDCIDRELRFPKTVKYIFLKDGSLFLVGRKKMIETIYNLILKLYIDHVKNFTWLEKPNGLTGLRYTFGLRSYSSKHKQKHKIVFDNEWQRDMGKSLIEVLWKEKVKKGIMPNYTFYIEIDITDQEATALAAVLNHSGIKYMHILNSDAAPKLKDRAKIGGNIVLY